MSEEWEKGRQRHSGLLTVTWVLYQQGAGEGGYLQKGQTRRRRWKERRKGKFVDIKRGQSNVGREKEKTTKSLRNNANARCDRKIHKRNSKALLLFTKNQLVIRISVRGRE